MHSLFELRNALADAPIIMDFDCHSLPQAVGKSYWTLCPSVYASHTWPRCPCTHCSSSVTRWLTPPSLWTSTVTHCHRPSVSLTEQSVRPSMPPVASLSTNALFHRTSKRVDWRTSFMDFVTHCTRPFVSLKEKCVSLSWSFISLLHAVGKGTWLGNSWRIP